MYNYDNKIQYFVFMFEIKSGGFGGNIERTDVCFKCALDLRDEYKNKQDIEFKIIPKIGITYFNDFIKCAKCGTSLLDF